MKSLAGLMALVGALGCAGEPAVLEVHLGVESPVRSDISTVRFRVEAGGEELRRSERAAEDYSVGFTRQYVVYVEDTAAQLTLILEGVTASGEVRVAQRRDTTLDFFGSTRSIELVLRCSCVGYDNISGVAMSCNSEECGTCMVDSADLVIGSAPNGFTDHSAGSVLHCGGCGQRCTGLQNVTGIECMQQSCRFLECDPDYADCDADTSNGCEASLNSALHCGECGAAVDPDEVCSNGSPIPSGMCEDGETECAGACVDLTRSIEHCGACGQACVAANAEAAACEAGVCSYTCDPGYGDCNAAGPNFDGCELALNEVAACDSCDRNCLELQYVTESYCRPVPGSMINARWCYASECEDGWGDCEPDLPDSMGGVDPSIVGCESRLTTTTHCGECDASCDADEVCCDGMCCSQARCDTGACPAIPHTGTMPAGGI